MTKDKIIERVKIIAELLNCEFWTMVNPKDGMMHFRFMEIMNPENVFCFFIDPNKITESGINGLTEYAAHELYGDDVICQ